MGAVGGLLGLGGGAGGSGFNTPSGTNQGQIQNSYNGNQGALTSQQQLLDALKSQNGLQNQTDVYGQLQNVANGQGPNPAQTMLAQATGQNVANQAALMAGQRGAAANVGLMARQAAQQGAGLQQQAAGQGASMQAQQSLNAIGAAGNMANTMASNQIAGTQANTAAQQNEQSILQGANSANNVVQGQLANTTMQGQQGLLGGIGNAAGAALHLLAEGGEVTPGAYVGATSGPQSSFAQLLHSQSQAPQGFSVGENAGAKALQGGVAKIGGGVSAYMSNPMRGAKNVTPGGMSNAGSGLGSYADQGMMAAGGGKVPAMVSPGEKFLRPQEAKAVATGKVSPAKVGEKIPGQAKVKGDSYKNDTVPKALEAGGVVIPRSVMQSKDPERGAADFVRAVLAKKGKRA